MAQTFTEKLAAAERANESLLCVGLDPEPSKFPGAWQHDASRIFDFCATIVDATKDLVIAFKPQVAYFAAQRAEDQLERLMAHIRHVAPGVPVILDAKRGDIGSTAEQYALEAFERYRADAVTLSPFMGFDSVEPWLKYEDKGLFLLCRTSNPGGSDLQSQRLVTGRPAVRAHRPPRGRPLEPQRPARPGGGCHLPGRDRARARAGAPTRAAADPRRGRAGRRCAGHRACRLARQRRTHHRAGGGELLARHPVRQPRQRIRRRGTLGRTGHACILGGGPRLSGLNPA